MAPVHRLHTKAHCDGQRLLPRDANRLEFYSDLTKLIPV